MPRVGLEPTQTYVRRILSPLRLPFRHPGTDDIFLEVAPRVELGIKVLQTTALPLGYATTFFIFVSDLVSTCKAPRNSA